jgi:deazaflavin-dependent oxidoreductase (nitroreductase family)
LYRLHLGWLLGHRFLQLTHRGRKSGRVYRAVLEVIRYDPQTRESVALSGWGERADWYRNLQAGPAIEVRTGGRRYVPVHRLLAPEEVYREMQDYMRRNRWAAGAVTRLIGLRFDGSDADRARMGTLRAVAFRPAVSNGEAAAAGRQAG